LSLGFASIAKYSGIASSELFTDFFNEILSIDIIRRKIGEPSDRD